jgi:hypothetical protein
MTVIETTESFIFRGFATVGWDSGSCYKADTSQRSFFAVKNPRGSEGRKCVLANSANAIYCNASYE